MSDESAPAPKSGFTFTQAMACSIPFDRLPRWLREQVQQSVDHEKRRVEYRMLIADPDEADEYLTAVEQTVTNICSVLPIANTTAIADDIYYRARHLICTGLSPRRALGTLREHFGAD
jgi:hypothetical protein